MQQRICRTTRNIIAQEVECVGEQREERCNYEGSWSVRSSAQNPKLHFTATGGTYGPKNSYPCFSSAAATCALVFAIFAFLISRIVRVNVALKKRRGAGQGSVYFMIQPRVALRLTGSKCNNGPEVVFKIMETPSQGHDISHICRRGFARRLTYDSQWPAARPPVFPPIMSCLKQQSAMFSMGLNRERASRRDLLRSTRCTRIGGLYPAQGTKAASILTDWSDRLCSWTR